MQATSYDIESLKAAQQADFDILHMTRELEELPQRQVIVDCRKKREALKEKMGKIDAVRSDIKRKLTRAKDEDASLIKKENGVQAAIEAAGNDYRNAEARTKELDGIFKRRQSLSEDISTLEGELAKVNELSAQADKALQGIDASEAAATDEFKREGGRLRSSIADAERKREELLDSLTSELSQAYRLTSERMGTVVVGNLEMSRCGVCRASIDPGRLIEVKAQAPVTYCPICKRLLIVDA
ncbi:MAG: hypothetical protein HFJ65_01385 [Eggerthellaceae bacterium]|nr:hypothetical protein [Eggerthellaceae bacterium]